MTDRSAWPDAHVLARVALAAAFALLSLTQVASVAAEPPAQAPNPTPANLRCPGPGLVPVPPPVPEDWTPALPIWGWENVHSFAHLNAPGYTSPLDVALGADCKIYVADTQRSEVVQLQPNGDPTGVRFRLPGESMPGETNRLQGVAVDPQGNVYATDYTRNLVHKFSPNGGLAATWGRCTPQPSANRFCDPKKEPGLFIGPSGIAADGRGNVYVSESAGTRIQKLNAQGQSQGTWDMTGRGLGELFILGGMAIDSGGNVYVADGFNDFIYKFDPNGALRGQIRRTGCRGRSTADCAWGGSGPFRQHLHLGPGQLARAEASARRVL